MYKLDIITFLDQLIISFLKMNGSENYVTTAAQHENC